MKRNRTADRLALQIPRKITRRASVPIPIVNPNQVNTTVNRNNMKRRASESDIPVLPIRLPWSLEEFRSRLHANVENSSTVVDTTIASTYDSAEGNKGIN